MLFLYTMRTLETLAPVRFALVLICAITLSVSGQAQDAVMNAPEVMPVLNSCALIEDRTEREACSNQGIMEHIIGKLEYPPAAQSAGIEGTVVVKFIINKNLSFSTFKRLAVVDIKNQFIVIIFIITVI